MKIKTVIFILFILHALHYFITISVSTKMYFHKCTDKVCNHMVGFTDTQVLQQIIRGLTDEDIQRKFCKCDQKGNNARVCASKKGEKFEAKALQAESLFGLEVNEQDRKRVSMNGKHLLSMTSHNMRIYRRFLNHLVYDKTVGRLITKRCSKVKLLDIDIIVLDVEKYELGKVPKTS